MIELILVVDLLLFLAYLSVFHRKMIFSLNLFLVDRVEISILNIRKKTLKHVGIIHNISGKK